MDKATPRFVLASSAIRCRFVNRFVRPRVLSRVSRQRFSPRDAPLPSVGSRRVRFPDVISTMRALRPPLSASPVAYLFRFRCPRDSSSLRARRCQRSRTVKDPPRARIICQPAIQLPACSHVDVSGTSQVSRRPILCLCPGLRPRPNQRTLASNGRHGAAPANTESRGFSVMFISRLPRGLNTCCIGFTSDVTTAYARLASGWLARLSREGVEPSGPR